jgi:tRNA pseudouridine55 synthase
VDRVLVVDKPSGVTSHDVVQRIRRTSGVRKVGHAGTLDPTATGVLLVLVGKATRLSQFLIEADKEYRGEMILGTSTDTQDADGVPVRSGPTEGINADDVRLAFSKFVGQIEQVPPMVSALKRDGTPLYVLARRGVTVEREPRCVLVSRLELVAYRSPAAEFEVACSKGTYVRTLAADVGELLGCGAHLGQLARTRVGRFTLAEAVGLEELEHLGGEIAEAGYSMFDALAPWPALLLEEDEGEAISTGGAVIVPSSRVAAGAGDLIRLTGDGLDLLAVGRVGPCERPDCLCVRPVSVFAAV